VTFASIDSVAKRVGDFPTQDVLLIDEAHRIPVRGEGKYRKFIDAMRERNPSLRVVGLTATPYRMGTGAICHRDHILNHVCYDANVGDLIRAGYLSPLRTIEGEHKKLDLNGVKKTAGEFNLKDLAQRVDRDDVVAEAVNHMARAVRDTGRKSIIVFCIDIDIDIDHCKHVAQELRKYGVDAGIVTGKTSHAERERLVEEFKAGRIQYLLSVNVFFEGFNAKRVDCVAMLRPTCVCIQIKIIAWCLITATTLRDTGRSICQTTQTLNWQRATSAAMYFLASSSRVRHAAGRFRRCSVNNGRRMRRRSARCTSLKLRRGCF
jgi:DNA repair protein RadD